jgi:uncharacterized membrane protein YhaH (DUF805 family)
MVRLGNDGINSVRPHPHPRVPGSWSNAAAALNQLGRQAPEDCRLTTSTTAGWVRAALTCLFGFEGRIGRLYYWLGLMAAWAIPGVLAAIADEVVPGTGDIGRYLAFMVIVGTLAWIHCAVTVKRLHDRDKSAAWYLLYGIAPPSLFVAAIYVYSQGALALTWVLLALSIAGLLWVLVELGLLRGTDGPNRYGPVP